MTFAYDQNGNLTQGHGESISYNAFNKPLTIGNGSHETRFSYGADLMRFRQVTPQGATVYYIDKLMEIETLGSASNYRHFLGNIDILTKTDSLNDSNPSVKYTFRDRLGGISMLGDKSGVINEYRGYDAYGKPRNSNWTDKNPVKINSAVTDRGFTDHEHLDDWQLIHMNGRGYDYNLGRFLSVDPFIQDPGNSQSVNAYAYIMNNPLSGTDPTGYFSKSEYMSSQARNLTGSRAGAKSMSFQGSVILPRSHPVMAPGPTGAGINGAANNQQSSANGSGNARIDELNGQIDEYRSQLTDQMMNAGLAGDDDTVLRLSGEIRYWKSNQDRFAQLLSYCAGSAGGCNFNHVDPETVDQLRRLTETLGMHAIGGAAARGAGFSMLRRAESVPNSGIWKLIPTDRGIAIEAALAKTEYKDWFNVGKKLNNGYFPLVDFQKGNTLVSLKSANTAGSTWMRRMTSHIDALANRGGTVNGRKANMVLDLRVQPGGANDAASLVQYGRQQGINVVVKEF